MARTSSAKITEWGTPPAPEPTGWDAIRIELESRPGEWANIGDFSAATGRKIGSDRFPNSAGFETRLVASKEGRVNVWVRALAPAADGDAADADAEIVEERSAEDDAASTIKAPRARRGAVV